MNIEFCSEAKITKLNNVQGFAQQMLFCFSWTFIHWRRFSGIYNNVIVEWKSKNKTCPFGELLFEKSLCSSSDARRFPRWLKFHFSRLKPLTVLPNYFFSSSITVSYKINIKLCWFLKVEKPFAIKLKELKELRIVLLFLSNPKIINNHVIRMKV